MKAGAKGNGNKTTYGAIIIVGVLVLAAAVLFSKGSLIGPSQTIGGQKDAHGCLIAAGYSWCEPKQKCLRTWEEDCTQGAGNVHVCTEQESLNKACTLEYSPVCGKITLNTGETLHSTFGNGCSACAAMKVVSYAQGGCAPDKTTEMCSDTNGNYMTLQEAADIAKAGECGNNLVIDCSCPDGFVKDGDTCNPGCYPKCLAPSVQCQRTYVCNEGTGTFWINLNITKQGCSPACVINLESKSAEINWRCTGLIQP